MSTRGLQQNEPDARQVYADIIDRPRWRSPGRTPMSLYDRAAQFAPFAALTGYDAMVQEEARQVEERIHLDDSALELLDQKLQAIAEAIASGTCPRVTLTYFAADPRKDGGKYVTESLTIKSIDPHRRTLVLTRRKGILEDEIPIRDILEIHSDLSSCPHHLSAE